MYHKKYPILEVNLQSIHSNIDALVTLLKSYGISLTGVVKGFNALPRIVDEFVTGGCAHIASSRLDQLARLKHHGTSTPLMLIRIPMASELEDLIEIADISLNSEFETIKEISKLLKNKKKKKHGILLMQDLGDLREGIFDPQELVQLAVHIEKKEPQLELKGIGTNLGCYGAIKPTLENLTQLCKTAEAIEKAIGRPLEIVSGGATSTLPLLIEGKLPKKINNLRIGEAILINRDLPDYWHTQVPGMTDNTFVLKAQVVEIKEKPSYPVGEIFIDAFGNHPEYQDRGVRKRAILAVGKQDFVDSSKLVPLLPGIEIVGASSDHLIVDIEDYPNAIHVGDIIPFGMYYSPLLYLSGSRDVQKVYKKRGRSKKKNI